MLQILIIFLLVNAVHFTMQPNEIFGALGRWLDKHLSDAIKPPVYGCNVCMSPWHGSYLYWLIPWEHTLAWWPIIVISAMGLQVVYNNLKPKDCT